MRVFLKSRVRSSYANIYSRKNFGVNYWYAEWFLFIVVRTFLSARGVCMYGLIRIGIWVEKHFSFSATYS